MKKRFTVILSVILAAVLCGCDVKEPDSSGDSAANNSSSDSSTTTESSTTNESSDSTPSDSEPEEPKQLTFLVGLDGKAIAEEDITEAFDGEYNKVSPSEITADNFGRAEAKVAFVAMPSGICRTSLDNASVFDSENRAFTDVPSEKKKEFVRVKEGDEICGFKVKSASSGFNNNLATAGMAMNDDGSTVLGKDMGIPEIYFAGGSLELEGSVELTGYIAIQVEDAYGVDAGEIKFIPSDCTVKLPVVYYEFNPEDGFFHSYGQVSSDNDIYFAHEYGYNYFRLGDVNSATVDLSGVPRDGSYVKVKVTVENIRLSSSVDWLTNVRGDITDITVL